MTLKVTIIVGGRAYAKELERRMKEAEPEITQTELGKLIGVEQTQISRWINRTTPSLDNVEVIEKAMMRALSKRKARRR